MNLCCLFFFNDTATTEIYTLSLHDALPISAGEDAAAGARRDLPRGEPREGPQRPRRAGAAHRADDVPPGRGRRALDRRLDRKSTRLNSSHANISYAVFCLKKKIKSHTKNAF